MKIGHGYDAHRLKRGLTLRLGGVDVPNDQGLEGHSDGDVVIHAVIDAVLGATGLGNIGRHFPSSDERWRGARSLDMLREVAVLLRGKNFEIGNVDVTVVAERPRLDENVASMQVVMAEALGTEADRISVKAKTTDGLGFEGAGEGISATAVALLQYIT